MKRQVMKQTAKIEAIPMRNSENTRILRLEIKNSIFDISLNWVRIGALPSLKIGDLERIDNMYKVRVYPGEKEEYITFTTPECSKELILILTLEKDTVR